jgi:hypothetical protein
MKAQAKVRSRENITLVGMRRGKELFLEEYSNLVTNAGKTAIAQRIGGLGGVNAFTYIAIGSGTTAEAVTDTALETEIVANGGERGVATVSLVTTDVTNDTLKLELLFTFTGSVAVSETGVLNAGSGGVLLNHKVFPVKNMVSGDTLLVIHTFDID